MAVGRAFIGIRWQAFEKQSMITRIVVNSFDGGRSVIKSIERCGQGRWGMAKGCNKPECNSLGVLHWAQTGNLVALVHSVALFEFPPSNPI